MAALAPSFTETTRKLANSTIRRPTFPNESLEVHAEIAFLRNEVCELNEKNTLLVQEASRAKKLEEKVFSLKETLLEMKRHLTFHLEENLIHKSTIQKLNECLVQRDTALVKLTEELRSLEISSVQSLEKLRKAGASLQEMEFQLKESKQLAEARQKELRKSDSLNGELKCQLDKLRREFSLAQIVTEALFRDNNSLHERHLESQKEQGRLSRELGIAEMNMRNWRREIDFYNIKTSEMKQIFKVILEEKSKKAIQADAYKGVSASLEARCNISEPLFEELQKRNEALHQENSVLVSSMRNLTEKLETLGKRHEETAQKLGKATGECEVLQEEVSKAQKEKNGAKEKQIQAEMEAEAAKVEKESLMKSIEGKNGFIREITKNLAGTRTELEYSNERSKDFELENRVLRVSQFVYEQREPEFKNNFTREMANPDEIKENELEELKEKERRTGLMEFIDQMKGSIASLKKGVAKEEQKLKSLK